MDLFAPIIIFGFLGMILYIYLFILNFFEAKHLLKNSLLLIVLICGFFAGSFFASISAMIFMYSISNYMKKDV